MNEEELYNLVLAYYKDKVKKMPNASQAQRDSLWQATYDELEAVERQTPGSLRQIHQQVFGQQTARPVAAPAESTTVAAAQEQAQPGIMQRLREEFAGRAQKAATMDAEEGTTGMDRFATGAVYGAINAPHRLAKGVLGIGRMFGVEEPYNAYSRWSQGFEDDYNAVTPYLGKLGMAGEMAGSLPTDIPLYASGMGVASKVPAIGRMLSSGGGRALAGEILGNAGVDFAQNAVIGAGYEGATPGSMARDGVVGTAIGGVANVGMAGVGAGMRGARRRAGAAIRQAGDRELASLPPDYIDNVIAADYGSGRRPQNAVWSDPKAPFDRPVRTPTPQNGMDLLSTMMGKAPAPAADELDVVQQANRAYENRFRRRPTPAVP